MTSETKAVQLADYRAPDFAVETVHLDIRLDPHATMVTAQLTMRATGTARDLTLDGDELRLHGLRIDGADVTPGRYDATPERLVVRDVPDGVFMLTLETELDPTANTKLMGLYRSSDTYCTQCEAEGFRRITYFPDRPDVLATYTTRLEAEREAAPVLLANGNPVESGSVTGTNRHFAVWHDPFPKPAYLFAMVAGDLALVRDSYTTGSGREVDLRIYCEHGNEARCAYAMDALKRSMRWDEETFGRAYDLDIFMIVAVSDFNMGAMENKGLNIFNDKYVLADSDTATDLDYAHIETVIAHEYFHNWTGNRITCREWFQLCLKEGLTVYRDQEFSADMRSRPVKRITDVRTLRARQFPEDAGPLAHPVRPDSYHEISNFYTPTVYEKGAELVRVLQTIVGEKDFRAGMDLYFERHDGQAVTIEDFVAAFADTSGDDLTGFFRWYGQAGTPHVSARGVYDAAARTYTLDLEQSTAPTRGQAIKAPVHIPVRFGLVGPNGEDADYDGVQGARVEGDIVHLTEARHSVVFKGVGARPVPSLLRGFSAPVRLKTDQTSDDLLFLMRADADPFNRWQAAQTVGMRALKQGTAAVARRERVDFDPAFIDALLDVAENEELEPAFRAQVLSLPGEADIAREIGRDIDPDAIAAARNQIRARIADRIGGRLARLYERMSGADGAYTPDAAAAGRRALANTALDLITANGDGEALRLTVNLFETADNMTNRAAALGILAAGAFPERIPALAAFYDGYQNDPLVLDKWLGYEAMVPATATLERVRNLLVHPAFTLSNPNRIRALIGSFAVANQTQFNRADGAGYAFLAEFVIGLDKRNPQTAARLLVSFRSWRALEAGRRALAQNALRKVAATTELSPDVRDIITRTLDA
ncbi:MAG: aminopeptidase N [Alphaproteobacteria bacterium]